MLQIGDRRWLLSDFGEDTMLGNTKYITLEGAKKMMAAAEAEARKNNWNVAISILDAGGNLILFEKMDEVQSGSVNVSIGKARTSVNFKRASKMIEDVVSARTAFLKVEGIVPIQGGLPVMVEGKLIGAVGVSGVKSEEDEQIAQAAINALKL
jgi:glc operon protein GlcG